MYLCVILSVLCLVLESILSHIYVVASSYRASTAVIRMILDSFPDAAGFPTRTGSSALHLMCDYGVRPDALHCVLQTSVGVANVAQEDLIYRRKPLHVLNGRKNMGNCQWTRDSMRGLRQRIRALEIAGAHRNANDIYRLRQTLMDFENDDTWRKASMLMVAEATGQALSEGDVVPMQALRAAIEIEDCPASFQEWAILLYSDKLMVPGADGCVPLHIAARRGSTGLLLDLLEACPSAAAVRDSSGFLPLQTFLQRPQARVWREGTGALLEAYPPALEELHLSDAVYPFVWSKLSSRESLFQAIRSCPRHFAETNER